MQPCRIVLLDHEAPLLGQLHGHVATRLLRLFEVPLLPVGGKVFQGHGSISKKWDRAVMHEYRRHCNAPTCEMERRAGAVVGRPAYLRVLRLLFLAARLRAVFFGTFAPAARASE